MLAMKILGVEFDDKCTMAEVLLEFKRLGLNTKTIPYHFAIAKDEQKKLFDLQQKTAQELVEDVDTDLYYIDLTN
jgi:hypothetical protein